MSRDLSSLFSPKSIAIIGASESPEKVGAIVLKNIIISGYKGTIYPVNPNITSLGNLKFYPDLNSLPQIPDLVVVAVPAAIVNKILTQAGDKGVKNVLIFSAGFKEIGSEGEKLENELVSIASKYQLNILGPNCLGFANNQLPLNATFGQVVKQSGNLRIISQSGAIAASLFDWCSSVNLGFSDFVTIGNKSVLNENDILQYWSDSSQLTPASPIGLYLESISHGQEFVAIASKLSLTNPIFMLKPGKSAAAAQAMHSHTGSIAGEDSVLEIALRQAGVIRCPELGDFFDIAQTLAWTQPPLGSQVAVISNAGGPAVLSTDTLTQVGLKLAKLSPETQTQLSACLPRMSSVVNPVDVLGDALADRFGQALEIALKDDAVHSVIVILTPQLMTQIVKTAEIIGNLSKSSSKPILCSFIGGHLAAQAEQILNQSHLPFFPFPERAIKTLALIWQWQQWRQEQLSATTPVTDNLDPNFDATKNILAAAQTNHHSTLDNFESDKLIQSIGISTPPTLNVSTLDQALSFAADHGYPVVLKLSSPGLLHKADIGGVITNLSSSDQLSSAWDKLTQIKSDLSAKSPTPVDIQIQKQIDSGVEVIVGLKRDPNFGPVFLFGTGGHLAELVADKNLSLLPLTLNSATTLVSQSKIYPLLSGYRGAKPYDLTSLYQIMVRLAALVQNSPDIAEIEINPVTITHQGTWALDAKVVLGHPNPFKTATTISHTLLNPKFHRYIFQTATPLIYQPGQYISIKVSDHKINAYSVVSANPSQFELLVDISPDGEGSHFFENLKVGQPISYLGPFGIFTFKPDDGADQLLFLGTGSGCSPLRSLIESALKNHDLKKSLTLYFGLRYQDDIFWQDYFEKLSQDHPNFTYKLCLSQPTPEWTGNSGHLTDYLQKEFPDASHCSAYICGNKPMIAEAKQILIDNGCPPERIYQEQFA